MYGIWTFLCFAFMIVFYGRPSFSYQIADVKKLLKDKEQNYDKRIRPVTNQSTPITVHLTFYLSSIQEVDAVQQTITIGAMVGMQWTDEEISWDPNDYGGLTEFTVNSDSVWTPEIVPINSYEQIRKIGDPWTVVRYTANGDASYYPGTILKLSNMLDITFYPWDRQECIIVLNAQGYTPEEYDLQNSVDEVITTKHNPSGTWDIIGSSVRVVKIHNIASYYYVTITIQRQPAYVIVNIILPVVILSLLSLMVYFIPTESGERMSFSITLLLAIAVFLTIVGDNLPKSSTPMALFSFYLLSVLVISNCVTLSVIYSLRLYHRDESEPIGGCWRRIVRVIRCKCNTKIRRAVLARKHNTEEDYENESISSRLDHRHNNTCSYQTKTSNEKSCFNLKKVTMCAPHSVADTKDSTKPDANRHNDYDETHENKTDTYISWKLVSITFDRLCFVFFLLLLNVITFTVFALIYTGLRQTEK